MSTGVGIEDAHPARLAATIMDLQHDAVPAVVVDDATRQIRLVAPKNDSLENAQKAIRAED